MNVRIVIEAQPMEERLELLSKEGLVSTRRDIIRWWEARRSHFNGYVLAVGFASWLLVMIAGAAAVKPGVDFEELLAMLFGTVIYVATANVCYTLGWVVDTIFYRGTPRTRLYSAGLVFSIILTALPGLWSVVAWLITVYTGRKLD
jgi:hypothetical protein